MNTKICSRCKIEKDVGCFSKDKTRKDGLQYFCKNCRKMARKKEYSSRYREKNKDRISEHLKIYYQNNKEIIKERNKKYRANNKGKYAELQIIYRANNREKTLELGRKHANKRLEIPKYKISHSISRRMLDSLRGNKNGCHWENLVGYTLRDLMNHLEFKFKDGMTWDNYGYWEIDHIYPVSYWEFKSYEDEQFKQCWALSNLQPLWARENLLKGAKIPQREGVVNDTTK